MPTMASVERVGFEPLLQIDMGVEVFASNWLYCDRLSSYVSRMVSHNRTDSLLYSNLLSSALNELLETAFRQHGAAGEFSCRMLRNGVIDRIELHIPCDEAASAFFRAAAEGIRGSDVGDQYRSALFAGDQIDPRIGLLELTIDYGARIEVEQLAPGLIVLSAQLNLEDGNVHA
jgi:hypothetical protein